MNAAIFLLLCIIAYLPNQLHLPGDFGVKGLNILNLLFLGLVALVFMRGGNQQEAETPLRGRVLLFIAMLVLAFLHAQMRGGGSLGTDITHLKDALLGPILFFAAFHALEDRRSVFRVGAFLLLVVFVAGLEAISEALAFGLGGYSHTARAAGPFSIDHSEANTAGVFFAVFLPLFLTTALFCRSRPFIRLLAAGGALVVVAGILFTYSRQSYLIVAMTGFLLCAYLAVWRRMMGPMLGLLLVTAVGLLFWLPQGVVERVTMTQEQTAYGQEMLDASTMSRFALWEGALEMTLDNPLFGVGLNRFKDHIGKYTPYEGMDAHNHYMLLLAETGPLGAAVLAALIFGLLGLARSLWPLTEDEEGRIVAVGYTLAVVGLLMGNVANSLLYRADVMGMFWILTALAAKYRVLRAEGAPAKQAVDKVETWADVRRLQQATTQPRIGSRRAG